MMVGHPSSMHGLRAIGCDLAELFGCTLHASAVSIKPDVGGWVVGLSERIGVEDGGVRALLK